MAEGEQWRPRWFRRSHHEAYITIPVKGAPADVPAIIGRSHAKELQARAA